MLAVDVEPVLSEEVEPVLVVVIVVVIVAVVVRTGHSSTPEGSSAGQAVAHPAHGLPAAPHAATAAATPAASRVITPFE